MASERSPGRRPRRRTIGLPLDVAGGGRMERGQRSACRAAVLVLAALGAAACAPEPVPDAQRVYRHSIDQVPGSLDPAHASTAAADQLVVVLYDTLYAYWYLARPYALKPNLAAAMPEVSADGLEVRIPIKRGVRFVDDPAFADGVGREVVAADVVYSLLRHFDPATRSQGAWLWQGRIEGLDAWKESGSDYTRPPSGLEAVDTHTLVLRLTAPYPQLVYTLTQGFSAVVPAEAVERYGPELARRPVGSGPFRLERLDDTVATLVRNRSFRAEPVDLAAEGYDRDTHGAFDLERIDGRAPPFVDRIEVSFVEDTTARWLSFEKGSEIQFAEVPASRSLDDIGGRYRSRSHVEAAVVFTAFNMAEPEVGYNDDPVRQRRNHGLRCAVIKAFDWAERNERFYHDRARVFPGVIPPSVPSWDPDLSHDSVTLDLPGARALLDAHGWTADNLPVLTYGSAGGATLRQFYEQFRGWMGRIGYPPEKIRLRQFAGLVDINRAWKQGELPLVTKAWILDYPDAQNVLAVFYGPNRSPGSNDANYNNELFNAMYDQAAVMPPSRERTRLYRAMNQLLIQDCVAMSGIARTRTLVWHDDVIAWPDVGMAAGHALRYVAVD